MSDKKHLFVVGETYKRRDGGEAVFIAACPHPNYPLIFWHSPLLNIAMHDLDGCKFCGPSLGGADILPPEPPLLKTERWFCVGDPTDRCCAAVCAAGKLEEAGIYHFMEAGCKD